MKAPTVEQINAWCRLKYGDGTGNRAYPAEGWGPAICNPDHGWIKELSSAQVRSIHIWTKPLQPISQGKAP